MKTANVLATNQYSLNKSIESKEREIVALESQLYKSAINQSTESHHINQLNTINDKIQTKHNELKVLKSQLEIILYLTVQMAIEDETQNELNKIKKLLDK